MGRESLGQTSHWFELHAQLTCGTAHACSAINFGTLPRGNLSRTSLLRTRESCRLWNPHAVFHAGQPGPARRTTTHRVSPPSHQPRDDRPVMSTLAPSASRAAAGGLAVALALGSVYILWGSTYLAIRFALESYPPFLLGAIRMAIAGALMFAVLRWRGAKSPTPRPADRGVLRLHARGQALHRARPGSDGGDPRWRRDHHPGQGARHAAAAPQSERQVVPLTSATMSRIHTSSTLGRRRMSTLAPSRPQIQPRVHGREACCEATALRLSQ
jgi:hypothetical protein